MKDNFKYGRVILEHHTYCNRNCDWCLAKYVDKYPIQYMSKEMLYIILNEIYNNIDMFKHDTLTFSLIRYNEPLYDYEKLIEFSKIIKDFFNQRNIDTFIYIHTNGDYLNPFVFEKVMEVIDEMTINDYSDPSIDKIFDKMIWLSAEIKIEQINEHSENHRERIWCSYKGKSVSFFINSASGLSKTTRGSVLQQYDKNLVFKNNAKKRDYECELNGRVLVIDYDGSVLPCCDTWGRIPFHKDMILGNIKDGLKNLKEIKNIFEHPACEYCHMNVDVCGYIDENKRYGDNKNV